MKSEDGTGGRRPLLGDVDCHPPISFKLMRQVTSVICLFYFFNAYPQCTRGHISRYKKQYLSRKEVSHAFPLNKIHQTYVEPDICADLWFSSTFFHTKTFGKKQKKLICHELSLTIRFKYVFTNIYKCAEFAHYSSRFGVFICFSVFLNTAKF